MNLYDEYKKLNRKYYDEEIVDFQADFEETKNKIKEYFKSGSKENINDDFNFLDKLRLEHSMSLAYLGVLINENLKCCFGNSKGKSLDMCISVNNVHFEFNYVWNIICFYHDIGYNFESNKNYIFKINNKNQKYDVSEYSNNKTRAVKSSKICYDAKFSFLYNRYFSNSFHQMFITSKNNTKKNQLSPEDYDRINNDFDIKIEYIKNSGGYEKEQILKKSNFYKSTIEKYYVYRKNEMGVFDHGILGGYMLFDNLVKNYVNKMASEPNKTEFIVDDRRCSIEQISLFAYMADCIASHNIFFPNQSYEGIYSEYGLNELIKYHKPVKFDSNPLLFLLYLVDSIDPIKYFEQKTILKYDEILKSIDIDFPICNTIKLSISNLFGIRNEIIEEYIMRIKRLSDWLGIGTNADYAKKSIEITIL